MGINSKVKAVFLDRDGVLNKPVVRDGKPYPPKCMAELEIINGVKEGVQQLKACGFILILVTNQPDVARGTTSAELVSEMNSFLQRKLILDDVYCCMHDSTDNCTCRKPKPGMIISAAEKWNIDLSLSYIIGDRWRDIETGKNAGIKTVLIDYQYDEKYVEPDFVCSSFMEAVERINSNEHYSHFKS
jgi:D-glycero-D-manno-heptose 1,7-bisphosphate phosphatase